MSGGRIVSPSLVRRARRFYRRAVRFPKLGLGNYILFSLLTIVSLIVLRDYEFVREHRGYGSARGGFYGRLIRFMGVSRRTLPKHFFRYSGYAGIEPGTFRDKHPSSSIAEAFDGIYVINHKECPQQMQFFDDRAEEFGKKLYRVESAILDSREGEQLPFNITIDFRRFPSVKRQEVKRHIGYYITHRQIWEKVVAKKHARVLILDSTLFPTHLLLRNLPEIFNTIDTESVTLRRPWHVMYFRRYPADVEPDDVELAASLAKAEQPWAIIHDLGREVVQTVPSYGGGIYALSLAGARMLLEHANRYTLSLDVQFALMQKQLGDRFIALSLCGAQRAVRDRCSDLVGRVFGDSSFQCTWRRLDEMQLSRMKLDEVSSTEES